MSRKARKFKAFFRPKLGDLQKKKEKKKRSSPKLRLLFRPISQIQTFEGGCFRMVGAIFHFSQKIGLKSTKSMRFCILHEPMGGSSPPPPPAPPGYATALHIYLTLKLIFQYTALGPFHRSRVFMRIDIRRSFDCMHFACFPFFRFTLKKISDVIGLNRLL